MSSTQLTIRSINEEYSLKHRKSPKALCVNEELLLEVMKNIHEMCMDTATAYRTSDNFVLGANAAGFVKVCDAMIDQGVF